MSMRYRDPNDIFNEHDRRLRALEGRTNGGGGEGGVSGGPGTPGADGQDGNTWFGGAGAPSGALGVVGDWYINTSNADVYEKTGASAWTLRLNIKGANGNAGAPGVNAGPVFSNNQELNVTTGLNRWYAPTNLTITNIICSVGTAPTGSDIRVDVNKNGTTIFSTQSTRPTIVNATFSDTLSVPQVTAVAALDYLTVDIDAVGSTYPGANLTVQVIVS